MIHKNDISTKSLTLFMFFLSSVTAPASAQQAQNLIIITTDGFRWQEVFTGMDSSIANNPAYNQDDGAYIFTKYWAADPADRRKKIMPFLWSTVEKNGQIYGNRLLGNLVDNANQYWFSYPGYNELFTGYPDTLINSNAYPPNPNTNLLEYLNAKPPFRNKIAAFGAWNAFDRILNEERSGIPVFSAFDPFGGTKPNATEITINKLAKDSYRPFGNGECLDVFTHYGAINYLQTKKPRVLYIAYGETDEWAHSGHYKDYVDAANQVDKWIKDIWNYIQSDPFYKNKTALFITTDHGRGDAVKSEWTSHNSSISDSYQIWFAAMGPGIKARGEIKKTEHLYQKQFAQTMASLLGQTFSSEHPIAEKIDLNRD